MIIKSFVLIEKEDLILLIREAALKWDAKWFLPGGKVEINETPEDGAHREVKEEAGCDINIKGIFYIKFANNFLEKQLTIFYSATIVGDELLKQIPDKHSLEVKWFTRDQITNLSTRQNLSDIIRNYNKLNILPTKNFHIK